MAASQEKYAGPGKAGQAFATGSAWGSVGWSVGLLTAAVGIGKSIRDTVVTFAKDSKPLVRGSTLLKLSFFIAPTAFVIGAVRGWMQADKAKTQFDGLNAEINKQSARAEALQMQVEGLNGELDTQRKSFAELHARHEQHTSHAAKLGEKIPLSAHSPEGAHLSHAANHESRAEHGSHADAALHDKHEAASAEHAV